ncbi:MAG: type III-B CRISPR module RAMP protein Cmr4, partial [Nitrospiraceae bacterium]|nr:type III-B CRISPR module RAMP protein Cmr4 [Nitrospiraceae bacterium]
IQRERHTQWPVIPGSALKGILRNACREKAMANYPDEYEELQENGQKTRLLKRSRRRVANEDDPLLVAAFGPGKVDESSAHAGAISLTDARILAFPVRSLRGVFAWVTCSAVLERLNRDLALSGQPPLKLSFSLGKEEAVCPGTSPLLVDGNKLVLEEFEFTQTKKAEDAPCEDNPEKKTTKTIADWIAARAVSDDATAKRIASHLVVLHNDDFTHFVRHATEIVARIGLDYERKTVRTGALFYQEFLPAETLFYSVVLANASRNANLAKKAGEILDYVGGRVKEVPVLQIGGDETTGKGICGVRLFDGKAGGQ